MGGFAAAEAARKIYVLPPVGGWNGGFSPGEALFYLPEKVELSVYVQEYRDGTRFGCDTSHCGIGAHVYLPDMDVVDIYRDAGWEF